METSDPSPPTGASIAQAAPGNTARIESEPEPDPAPSHESPPAVSNLRITHTIAEGQIPVNSDGPSIPLLPLLPSVFPNSPPAPLPPHAEGYEGDRLSAMFTQASIPPPSIAPNSQLQPKIQDPASPQQAPRPLFTPLFTIIEDLTTHVTHHPHVHYIFSDDDPDLLAHGIVTSLREKDERAILLTLDVTGRAVVSSRSLSAEWAVLSADVGPAPTFGGKAGEGESAEQQKLMIRIKGTDVDEGEGEEGKDEDEGNVEGMIARVEGLARRFDGEMEVLRRVKRQGSRIGFGGVS